MSYESAARELLRVATRLTPDGLVQLGMATRREAGPKLRRKSEWIVAMRSATAAAAMAGRSSTLSELQTTAVEVIMTSALSYAASRCDRTARLQASFDNWKDQVDKDSTRRRHRAFSRLQLALLRAVGFRVQRRIGEAIEGTGAAVTALTTWDLATNSGAYTAQCRSLLVIPWRDIAELPFGDK